MLRLAKIIKPWTDAGSLNANINLYGFWDETTFLTKSGDLGMILKVCGVDFESLDHRSSRSSGWKRPSSLSGPDFMSTSTSSRPIGRRCHSLAMATR
jgi:hypothetical protein